MTGVFTASALGIAPEPRLEKEYPRVRGMIGFARCAMEEARVRLGCADFVGANIGEVVADLDRTWLSWRSAGNSWGLFIGHEGDAAEVRMRRDGA